MQTKNHVIQGAGQLGKNDFTYGQANSTGMPPDQKCKQSWGAILFLYNFHAFSSTESLFTFSTFQSSQFTYFAWIEKNSFFLAQPCDKDMLSKVAIWLGSYFFETSYVLKISAIALFDICGKSLEPTLKCGPK